MGHPTTVRGGYRLAHGNRLRGDGRSEHGPERGQGRPSQPRGLSPAPPDRTERSLRSPSQHTARPAQGQFSTIAAPIEPRPENDEIPRRSGKVEQRDVGGWSSADARLYVDNRNQTKLIDGLNWQVEGVRAALTPIGFGDAPVHPSICFTNSEWGLFTKPIRMNGVVTSWAANLTDQVRAPGPLDASAIELLARHLSTQLSASH